MLLENVLGLGGGSLGSKITDYNLVCVGFGSGVAILVTRVAFVGEDDVECYCFAICEWGHWCAGFADDARVALRRNFFPNLDIVVSKGLVPCCTVPSIGCVCKCLSKLVN